MAIERLWRVVGPHSAPWREAFRRLAAETPEGRRLAPEFHGNILSFNSSKQDRGALRLIKDLMVQASFAVEHQGCGEIKAYVGDTRVSMSCSCGAEIVRRLTG
ncbi:MAG TPA: hypothetical protein VIF11_17290 [Methylomirabilota bacterium]|jgi:hypothetical protein